MNSEEIAMAIAEYASDRKALDIVQLDLREVTSFTDYFVIATGRSDRQVKAIHDAILEGMKHDHATVAARVEGLPEATWVLLDYGDVVVHIFTQEMRDFYRLETLWGEAPVRELTFAAS